MTYIGKSGIIDARVKALVFVMACIFGCTPEFFIGIIVHQHYDAFFIAKKEKPVGYTMTGFLRN